MSSRRVHVFIIAIVAQAITAIAGAQTIDLSAGGADLIWHGTVGGSRAGGSMDLGAVDQDTRRDLLIGAPGGPGIIGHVYMIFDGSTLTGNHSLGSADAAIDGAAAGDLFGAATAVGNILSREGSLPTSIAVGAPGALGNRGIVYVFPAGFTNGEARSASAAPVKILGAPGDQLGTVIATADMNNDGFREILIGAPGNSRIYVIGGGANLPATIDLSASPIPAAAIYPFAGFGSVLAAGDITGDGISDMIIGQPSNNAVWIVRGRNGSMPNGAIDIGFTGIDAGDAAGTAVRVLDLDGDGVRDLAIGAPGGDGPTNSRTDSGEVYVIYGGSALATRSLASADVTFYGKDFGMRLGSVMTAGDINRDRPNDLVMGSETARGGAGSLDVYYGRDRGLVGTRRVDGTRIVDFLEQAPDRSIWGDLNAGTITSAQVYEVTGEGARDVIVGMAGHANNTGAVYFTLSPRLTLGASLASLNGYQGAVSTSPIPVTNISTIAITWSTSTDRPWLSATPQGSTNASTPGNVVITANGSGLAPGTYTGTVQVRSTSTHLEMVQSIAVTFTVQESLPNPSSQAQPGFPAGARYNILWRSSLDGWLALWNMDGVTLKGMQLVSINQMPDANWRIVAYADLNGDGQRDIVWQHATQGWLAAWMLQGNQVVATNLLSINKLETNIWKIAAAGDLNGDGRADLIWQTDDGKLATWFMDGFQVLQTVMLSIPNMPDGNWRIVGSGDLDGDGHADIVWRHRVNGSQAVWLMNGANVVSTRMLSIPQLADQNWSIVGVVDVNGDRKADLLWQHSSGQLATWYMDAERVIATFNLNPSQVPNTNWKIQGPK
jgi:hypothetical protein